MLQIHEVLQTGEPTNCNRLARSLEVSARTVQRDIDFMRDQLGLPIEYEPTERALRYTREVVQFPTMKISEGELVALSVARQALTQYRGTPFEKPLRDAFEKLTAGLRDQIQFTWSGDFKESISFRAGGQGVGDLSIFEIASEAVLRHEELTFAYRKLASDREEERCVQPLHLACIDNQWYLFGFDLGRSGSVRTFALTRIQQLRNTGRTFVRPKHFSLDEHLADSFGVFSSPEAEGVRLRFDAFAGRLIGERTWHSSQQLETDEDGRVTLTMHVGISPEVERWILGWGEHVEVIGPATLRAKIADTAVRVCDRYGVESSAARPDGERPTILKA